MNGLLDAIRRSVNRVLEIKEFTEFAEEQRLKDGDWVLLNNSLLLRSDLGLKTKKNSLYLAFKIRRSGERISHDEIAVIRPDKDLNNAFRKLSADQIGPRSNLDESVRSQVENLGSIVTCLIGQICVEPTQVGIDHRRFTVLSLSPESEEDLVVVEPEIKIQKLRSVATHWPQLEAALTDMGLDRRDIDSLAGSFDAAYKALREKHHEKIRLPSMPRDLDANDSVLSRVVISIEQEIQRYRDALNEFLQSDSENAYHEVLRISYNFAEALFGLLGLIVGICDLKPILFWLTCGEQMELNKVFQRELLRHQTGKKPSLRHYRDAIGGARNHRFHTLLSFPVDVVADLHGVHFAARSLRMFTEYKRTSSQRTVTFEFEDREIVELLTTLTRTPEHEVPSEWWESNLRVMEATLQLVRAFERALVNAARVALEQRRQAA